MRTIGMHRRISKEEIERIIAGKKRRYSKKKRGVVSYARVSSHDKKKRRGRKNYSRGFVALMVYIKGIRP
ncbi:MAG: hypothetical protein ACTSYA_13610 [Candidatus Kariarchaeaceae archaeon]